VLTTVPSTSTATDARLQEHPVNANNPAATATTTRELRLIDSSLIRLRVYFTRTARAYFRGQAAPGPDRLVLMIRT